MSDFRFTLISIFVFIIIAGLGVLGYLSLEPGDRNGARQLVRELESQLASKDEALQEALRRVAQLEADNTQLKQGAIVATNGTDSEKGDTIKSEENLSQNTNTSTSKTTNPTLLAALESLKTRGVILEPGDTGADVGTIQKFLNAYESKTGGIDNDFGPTTRKRVESFQKANGLSVDGGVGPGTLSKMITWMESH